MNAWELLPLLRELYSRQPETRHLLAWELRIVLWSFGYTYHLEDEGEIAAAREIALTDASGEAA
jgi:hypothetical protein